MTEKDYEDVSIPKTDKTAKKYWEKKHELAVKRYEKDNWKRRERDARIRGSKWINA